MHASRRRAHLWTRATLGQDGSTAARPLTISFRIPDEVPLLAADLAL